MANLGPNLMGLTKLISDQPSMLTTHTPPDRQVIASLTDPTGLTVLPLVPGRGEPPVWSRGQGAGPSPWTGGVTPPLVVWAMRRREEGGGRDTGGRGGATPPLVWDWCEKRGAATGGEGGLPPLWLVTDLRKGWGWQRGAGSLTPFVV